MPQYKVVYRHPGVKPGHEVAGDAYVIEAKTEAAAKREVRRLLLNRFGSTQPGMADINKQLVPTIAFVLEL